MPKPIDIRFALDRIAEMDGVVNAMHLSSEGLPLAVSEGFAKDSADHCAAAMSGLTSLSNNIGPFFDRSSDARLGWMLTMVAMTEVTALVFKSGENTCIAVAVDDDMFSTKVAVVSNGVKKLIIQLNTAMDVPERTSTPGPA